jgi:hypothetical protein
MDNKLAHFKAKYGASCATMAALLQAEFDDVRDWSKYDTTPKEMDDKVDALNKFVEQLIDEGKALGDQAPAMQVLQYQAEVMAREIEGLETNSAILKHKIDHYEGLNFWGRLAFLFSPKPKSVAVVVGACHE